jgi:hypothetical protein
MDVIEEVFSAKLGCGMKLSGSAVQPGRSGKSKQGAQVTSLEAVPPVATVPAPQTDHAVQVDVPPLDQEVPMQAVQVASVEAVPAA